MDNLDQKFKENLDRFRFVKINVKSNSEVRRYETFISNGGFQTAGMPSSLHPGIFNYYVKGIEPGHFLQAVLKNNLIEAVTRNSSYPETLHSVILWLLNQFDGSAWGSEEKYVAHINKCKDKYEQEEASLILKALKEK